MHYPMAFVIPVMEQWLEQEIAQWVHLALFINYTSQGSMTGVTNVVICAILSLGWCI